MSDWRWSARWPENMLVVPAAAAAVVHISLSVCITPRGQLSFFLYFFLIFDFFDRTNGRTHVRTSNLTNVMEEEKRQ